MWLISQVGPIKKYSQVGALGLRLFYCEMFGVKSEGNLMPDAINQLVGSIDGSPLCGLSFRIPLVLHT